MTQMIVQSIESLVDYQEVKNKLIQQWTIRHNTPNIFRYKLNVRKQKRLSGLLNLYVELNVERSTLRRHPQKITSLVSEFDENRFNFNKINENEYLLECISETRKIPRISFLINNSPLTRYHSLVCPDLRSNYAQVLTFNAIKCAVDIMLGFDDSKFKIAYNSSGAFASVNHLHMHLLYIEAELIVERVETKHLIKNIFKISEHYPAIGYCFRLVNNIDNIEEFCNDIYRMICVFNDKVIPHNLFWTLDTTESNKVLNVFVYPRERMGDKFSSFNVASCEFSGYVVVGDESIYETLTEDKVVMEIKNAIGNLQNLDAEIKQIYS